MEQPKAASYTYDDYLTWPDGKRYELIDGVPYMLAAPSSSHQEIVANLIAELVFYLKGKTCKAFPAPFDVRLNADAADDTVVQPDISVICDPDKLDERGVKGAPDMIVEIISPSTAQRDQVVKFNQYLAAGVREYWIISPEARSTQVYLLENGKYIAQVYDDTATVSVHILEDCQINLADVFPKIAPDAQQTEGEGEHVAD